MKLQEMMGEGRRAGSEERPVRFEQDDLLTIAEENKRLKDQVKVKDAELRNIHVRQNILYVIRLRRRTIRDRKLLERGARLWAMYSIP